VNLLQLIVLFVLIGVAMWAVNTYIPMAAGIKKLLNVVVIIVLVLWLLISVFHIGSLESIRF